MKLTIIGYWGAYPEKNAATSAYLLEEENFTLLIDCGSGCLSQLQNYIDLSDLDALILSHYHHDHIADVGSLQYNMLINKHLGKKQEVFPIYGHSKDTDQFERLTFRDVTKGFEIAAGMDLKIGPWEVSFCETVHPAPCLAMRISNGEKHLVYTGDTYWCDELVPFTKEADLLLCEASLYKSDYAHLSGHSTPEFAGSLAKQAQVEKLILTHLPHFGDHQELLRMAKEEFSGSVHLAKSGLTVEL
ncbi:MBL fold metallo-hydrolase [Evansella sp. AB-rgal1]|uniref:MBL fold metallo-hydrolase n=1 Tax=Evansella sp. AB-rgal1 TaxID=3242696 RepID=UPI00359D9B44